MRRVLEWHCYIHSKFHSVQLHFALYGILYTYLFFYFVSRIKFLRGRLFEVCKKIVVLKKGMCQMSKIASLVGFRSTFWIHVIGPPGALLFDVKPDIALKESLELQFCSNCCLGHLLHRFPVIPVTFDITCKTSHAIHGFWGHNICNSKLW